MQVEIAQVLNIFMFNWDIFEYSEKKITVDFVSNLKILPMNVSLPLQHSHRVKPVLLN